MELQIPPLRCAPVGMTKGGVVIRMENCYMGKYLYRLQT
jgi:hypothetical protein